MIRGGLNRLVSTRDAPSTAPGRDVLVRFWVKARPHAPIIAVFASFTAAAFIVPTLAPVATTDDWGYTRSVELLYHEGHLTVFPVVAATAVFQVLWGALFAHLFGMSLGVMRLSTVVMVGLGGLALYGLCRQLGISRGRGALGVAAYLFNPLVFVLAFTYMTDPHFTSLLIVATLCYVRGLSPDRDGRLTTIAGSVAAAAALLTRQQGVLIPLAAAGYLLLSGQLRPNRASIASLARIGGIPLLAAVGYVVWLQLFNDVPDVQQSFFAEARAAGVHGTWTLVRHLTFFESMYLGFFALPIVAAATASLGRSVRTIPRPGWIVVAVGGALFLAALATSWEAGRRMPYLPQFFGAGGLGPPDVRGSRPILFELGVRGVFTVVCAIATVALGLLICRSVCAQRSPDRAAAGLVLAIGLGQVAGIVPPSYHYLNRGFSLDRYLLPLVPLGIVLALWSVRDLRFFAPVAWVVVGLYALFAVAGTRDYLVYMNAVWTTGHNANTAGVANEQLDAGAAWDGYHLYTLGLDQGITRARTRDGPWWLYFYGKASDSTYVVSAKPLPGYEVVWERDYSSWLQTAPTQLYLLHREGALGPLPEQMPTEAPPAYVPPAYVPPEQPRGEPS